MIFKDASTARMYDILAQHIEAGHVMLYYAKTNSLLTAWEVPPNSAGNGGYLEYGVCKINQWFTEDEQDAVFDLIYPAI